MNKDYTHILFILDDSASMNRLQSDAIEGFNKFVKEQKELDGKCKLDTILFSEPKAFRYFTKNKDINEVEELTEKDYSADGWSTSLIDAIGRGVTDLGKFLKNMDESERPSKVLVNIFTDGEENSSEEYTHKQLQDMIKEQSDVYNWEFAFLASDVRATSFARNSGFKNVALTEDSSRGMSGMYTAMSNNTRLYRTSGKVSSVQDEYDRETEDS